MQSSVVVVARHEGQVLMLLRHDSDREFPGVWCFPGGKIEPGEDALAAAAREVREETGFTCDPMHLCEWHRDPIVAVTPRQNHVVRVFELALSSSVVSRLCVNDPSPEHARMELLPLEMAMRQHVGGMTRAVLGSLYYEQTPHVWPLPGSAIVLPDEPGQFAAVRKHDVHCGVDLYCEMGSTVVAMTSGTVVLVEPFTGAHVVNDPSPHWNDTFAVLVEGASTDSGVITYGEITPLPHIKEGYYLMAGEPIGHVLPVLRTNKGRPMCMLHFEHMRRGTRETFWWHPGQEKPEALLNPDQLLERTHLGRFERFDMATYDGKRFIDPSAPVVRRK